MLFRHATLKKNNKFVGLESNRENIFPNENYLKLKFFLNSASKKKSKGKE